MKKETLDWLIKNDLNFKNDNMSDESVAQQAESFWLSCFEKELKKMIMEEYQILSQSVLENQKSTDEELLNIAITSSAVIRGLERVKEWFDEKINISLSRFEKS